jgi:hypothetical protein
MVSRVVKAAPLGPSIISSNPRGVGAANLEEGPNEDDNEAEAETEAG